MARKKGRRFGVTARAATSGASDSVEPRSDASPARARPNEERTCNNMGFGQMTDGVASVS
jgi:hypothetical protein